MCSGPDDYNDDDDDTLTILNANFQDFQVLTASNRDLPPVKLDLGLN